MNTLARYVETAKEWLAQDCTGDFAGAILDRELGIKDVNVRNQVLADLISLGLIETVGGRHGIFAPVHNDCPRIDWQTATGDWFPIKLPFGLDKMCGVRPKNIAVVAGEPNSGKTWFMLKIAHDNLRENGGLHDSVHYFNSEMVDDELRTRLLGLDPIAENWHGLDPRERNRDFHSVIHPDGLNVIDFLEISDKFYLIADKIQKIHERLTTGIAVIAIQKQAGQELGRGGSFSMEKCRLGLALSFEHGLSTCRITKCKSPLDGRMNPQGQELDFRLQGGSVAVPVAPGWRWVSERERKDIALANEQAQIASRFSQKWAEYE